MRNKKKSTQERKYSKFVVSLQKQRDICIMVSTETYINFIIENLRKGIVNYSENVSVFCSKFQLTERTFASYWKKANNKHIDELRRIEKEKSDIATQQAIKSTERNILSKYEALEILTGIAQGDKRDYENYGSVVPSDSERKAAVEVICKIEGWFVPEKKDIRLNSNLPEWLIGGEDGEEE